MPEPPPNRAAHPNPSGASTGDRDVSTPAESRPSSYTDFPEPTDFQTILRQLAEGVILTDSAGRITFVNEAARRIHGVAELAVEVDDYSDTYQLLTMEGQPYPPKELPLARAVLYGDTVTDALWRIRRPDNTEVVAQGSAQPILDANGIQKGAVLIVRDITQQFTMAASQQFLAEASALLSVSLDFEETLQGLAGLVVPRLADWCAIDILEQAEGEEVLRRVATVHSDPDKQQLAQDVSQKYPPRRDGSTGPYNVIRTGKSECVNDITDQAIRMNVTDDEQYRVIRGLGLRAYLCAPLIARGRVIGVLSLLQAESERRCSEIDVKLAEDLGQRAGLAVDNARLFQQLQLENIERTKLEATLRASEQRLAITIRSIGDAVIATDHEGRVALMNDVAADLTGWTEQDALGKPCETVFNIVDEFSRKRVENPVSRVLREGVVVGLANHTLLVTKSGAIRPIDDSGAPIFDPDNHLIGVVLVFRDVTERRKTERAIIQQAELLELTADAVIVHDGENRVTYWNRGAEQKYGWLRDEAIGKVAQDLLNTVFPISLAEIRQAVEKEGHWEGELVHTRRDGQKIVVASRWAMQRDAEGNPIAILEINRDITPLIESEARFRTIVEQSPFSIQVLSPEGNTTMVNPAWEQLWGLTLDQIADYNILEDTQLEEKGIAPYIRRGFAGEPSAIPAIMYDPNETLPGRTALSDSHRWVDAYIYPVHDAFGVMRQVILVHQDVTARVKSTEELERNSREIAELNRRLQRAMTETHHRVKNSLQMIAAMIDMQTMTEEPTLLVEDVKHLAEHVKTLAAVHDLLTEGAKSQGHARTISARRILEKLIPMLQQASGSRSVTVRLDDADLEARKATGLALVTAELFMNAVKHGTGEVEVTLAVTEDFTRLEVCDDGPGFPANFSPDSLDTTGLGLVENLTRWDLGGSTEYTNRPEGGARIVVSIPLGLDEASSGPS